MLLEVRLAGKVMFWTASGECVPTKAVMASMRSGGYQVYLDGKRVA